MKSLFSLVGLLVVLAIVALLVKKQLATPVAVPMTGVTAPSGQPVPANPTVLQGQQLQQQVKQAVETAIQPRPAQDGQ